MNPSGGVSRLKVRCCDRPRKQGGQRRLPLVCLLGVLGFMGLIGNSRALELDALIDRVQVTYDRMQALTADFEQIATLKSINRQQFSSGRLYIEKPHRIRWEYNKPERQTILYDGSTLRIYTPKRRQLLQSAVDESTRSNVALLFLAGVVKLRDVFAITALPETETTQTLIRLLPRSRLAGFTELRAAINPRSYFIEGLWIHDPIGNHTEIRLSSLTAHAALPAHTFALDLPPDTEILSPSAFAPPR